MPFEGILIEVHKGSRRKHNMKFRQLLDKAKSVDIGDSYLNRKSANMFIDSMALWCGPRIASLPLPRYVVKGD